MFTFVRVLLLLVEKQKQAKDYSVNSLQTNAEVNQAIYRGIIAICFLNIAIYRNTLLTYRDSPRKRALMLYANSKGPDQHVHTCSLIWAFSNC